MQVAEGSSRRKGVAREAVALMMGYAATALATRQGQRRVLAHSPARSLAV
jgi:hypothetical protein